MKKSKRETSINWKSKLIDLLIVIIGITIAFQLNNWNEINKKNNKEKEYITNFFEENKKNELNLNQALVFLKNNKKSIDTLKHILHSRLFSDNRIESLSNNMLMLGYFKPITITMENIKASGDFEVIQDVTLRRQLIELYTSYTVIITINEKLGNYIDSYVTPFFFEKVRFSDFRPINNKNFINEPRFENIVLGYEQLLNQQILVYQATLNKLKSINEK